VPKLLTLVPKTDPILRNVMPEEQDFKDPVLQETIKDMCYSILPEQLKESAAGMAANQWGIKKRIFIVTPNGSESHEESEVVINPSYVPYLRAHETEYKLIPMYEGCFSIPLAVGLINRYDAIMATYYTPTGDKIERIMEGWEARVFQHETDHLDGKLYDGKLDHYSGPECLDRISFKNAEEKEAWRKARRNANASDNKK
jgi:peptide deformylase